MITSTLSRKHCHRIALQGSRYLRLSKLSTSERISVPCFCIRFPNGKVILDIFFLDTNKSLMTSDLIMCTSHTCMRTCERTGALSSFIADTSPLFSAYLWFAATAAAISKSTAPRSLLRQRAPKSLPSANASFHILCPSTREIT